MASQLARIKQIGAQTIFPTRVAAKFETSRGRHMAGAGRPTSYWCCNPQRRCWWAGSTGSPGPQLGAQPPTAAPAAEFTMYGATVPVVKKKGGTMRMCVFCCCCFLFFWLYVARGQCGRPRRYARNAAALNRKCNGVKDVRDGLPGPAGN